MPAGHGSDGPCPFERYLNEHTSTGAAGAALSIAPVILSTRLAFLLRMRPTVERESCQATYIHTQNATRACHTQSSFLEGQIHPTGTTRPIGPPCSLKAPKFLSGTNTASCSPQIHLRNIHYIREPARRSPHNVQETIRPVVLAQEQRVPYQLVQHAGKLTARLILRGGRV